VYPTAIHLQRFRRFRRLLVVRLDGKEMARGIGLVAASENPERDISRSGRFMAEAWRVPAPYRE
jgi:hypothetical protein